LKLASVPGHVNKMGERALHICKGMLQALFSMA
jgi:hypothetical protein